MGSFVHFKLLATVASNFERFIDKQKHLFFKNGVIDR
jgi:hypothetical protein